MNLDQIIPLITDTSSTVVLIALFIWTLTRLPKQIAESITQATQANSEETKDLARAVLSNSQAIEKLAEKHVSLSKEVHKLAVLLYAALASKEELRRFIDADEADSRQKDK